MASNLTVADVREALWQEVDPNDPNSPQFLPALNQVCERILNSGLWKGTYGVVDFSSATDYITLPRRWESIIGCTVKGVVQPVYGQMHEFLSSGPGPYEHLEYDLGLLIDQGEFPTVGVQTESLPIRLTANNTADAGRFVRLYGVDTNGDPVFDDSGIEGITVELDTTPVTTSQSFLLTGVAKDATLGTVTLSQVDGVTVTALSTYEPTETRPVYRRYKVGTITANTGVDYPAIRTLCKRRFIKLACDTDLVYPSDLGALKFGLIAWTYERQGAFELEKAEMFWQKCYQVANQTLKQMRGNIRLPLNQIRWSSAGGSPTTI
jgi:hypothetical protein